VRDRGLARGWAAGPAAAVPGVHTTATGRRRYRLV
jgi:hypothetical protein